MDIRRVVLRRGGPRTAREAVAAAEESRRDGAERVRPALDAAKLPKLARERGRARATARRRDESDAEDAVFQHRARGERVAVDVPRARGQTPSLDAHGRASLATTHRGESSRVAQPRGVHHLAPRRGAEDGQGDAREIQTTRASVLARRRRRRRRAPRGIPPRVRRPPRREETLAPVPTRRAARLDAIRQRARAPARGSDRRGAAVVAAFARGRDVGVVQSRARAEPTPEPAVRARPPRPEPNDAREFRALAPRGRRVSPTDAAHARDVRASA